MFALFKLAIRALLWVGILFGVYLISIIWRVSVAEKYWFGRSELIPLAVDRPQFKKPPVLNESYTSRTYEYIRPDGKTVIVWKEKINAFQHVYASALMAYETTPVVADKTFCVNEYLEATLDPNGINRRDLMDRKKDLAHNRVGRAIAAEARNKGLAHGEAEKWMQQRVLEKMTTWQDVYPHHWDPRVKKLDEAALGCPNLPHESLRAKLTGTLEDGAIPLPSQ